MERENKGNGQPARIAKVIARAGLCSRREAERWIKAGRVSINGKVCKDPAINIDTADGVKVDGFALPVKEPVRVWRYYKPVGLLTTERDPEKRKTIFDFLPSTLPRVISVGRLDLNSEGLLLLTNDGELSRQFELPATGWERHYRVRVFGRPQKDSLRALANGISVAGVRYAPIEVKLENQSGANRWLRMTLREGKNREIRKVCESFGWRVNRLIRISYGPFELGNLKRGEIDEVHFKKLAEYIGPEIISCMPKAETSISPNDKKGRRI